MGEAEMLIQTGADLVRVFEHGPRSDCRRLANGAIALSGETPADLNMILLAGGASRAEFDEALAAVERLQVEAILVVEEGGDALRAWAAEAGLAEVGRLPLMERPAGELPLAPEFVVRLGRREDVAAAMRMSAAAFGLGEAACRSAFPAAFLDREGNELWLAEERGAPVGSGVFVRSGDHVGVYDMATPPDQQRRGIGRAILAGAMAHYQAQGVARFTLGATEAGYRLYEDMGFAVAALPRLYVIGASTQFPGR